MFSNCIEGLGHKRKQKNKKKNQQQQQQQTNKEKPRKYILKIYVKNIIIYIYIFYIYVKFFADFVKGHLTLRCKKTFRLIYVNRYMYVLISFTQLFKKL